MSEKPLIFAVDDEEDFLEIASVYLESSGFRAETSKIVAERELLRRCEDLKPVVAILDVYAKAEPVGLVLAAALKKNPKTSHIKIILWSSASEPADSPADDFFNKSADLTLLLDKVRRQMPAAIGTS